MYYYQKNEKNDNQNLFNSKIITSTTIEITESNVTTAIPPKISEQLETQEIVKVIILSVNPRSGSTYLSGTQSFTTSLMTYHLIYQSLNKAAIPFRKCSSKVLAHLWR